MARWPGGAQERLQDAAIELFAAHGYDRTTVAEIARRAGLTERTFYNHFADKREVLFPGQTGFVADLVEAVAAAPSQRGALDAVVAALAADTDWFDARRDAARRRRRIIDAHRELQERELTKMAAVGAALAGALRGRGGTEVAATLTAASAVAAYQLATAAWLSDPEDRGLAWHLHAAVEELRRVAERW